MTGVAKAVKASSGLSAHPTYLIAENSDESVTTIGRPERCAAIYWRPLCLGGSVRLGEMGQGQGLATAPRPTGFSHAFYERLTVSPLLPSSTSSAGWGGSLSCVGDAVVSFVGRFLLATRKSGPTINRG